MQSKTFEPPVFSIDYKQENYYTGNLPYFQNSEDYPWLKNIENQWEVMRDEILDYIKSGKELQSFTSPTSPGLSSPLAWKKIYFMNFLWMQYSNCKKFPQTWSILKQIPGITLGGILILEPHSKILPHCSESNINIRCHLGIKIPADYPVCGIRVGKEERGWENGKTVLFSDCHEHTVWNDSDDIRIIVAFDVLKKEYDTHKKWMCALYLGVLTLRSLGTYFPFRKVTPVILVKPLHYLVSFGWYVYLHLQSLAESLLGLR
jgi:aspartyl/asparaginyl beta-hydroxylase (cupin superfamily)